MSFLLIDCNCENSEHRIIVYHVMKYTAAVDIYTTWYYILL